MSLLSISHVVFDLTRLVRQVLGMTNEPTHDGLSTLTGVRHRDVEAMRQLERPAGLRPLRPDLAAATSHDPDLPPVELTAWPPIRRPAAPAQSPATHEASCCQSVA